MNKKSLSPKGQAFCREYIATSNATASYMKVYGQSNFSTASTAATLMLKKPEVQAYLAELRKPLEEAALSDRQRRTDKLWQIIDHPGSRDADRLRALDILARMAGDYKLLPTEEGDSLDLSGMSEAELQKILNTNPA